MSIYEELCDKKENEKRPYTDEAKKCIERTVDKLLDKNNPTTAEKPGMLLGKIQSGKTQTFIGIIARAFDKGYDISIVLTKGTKALAIQTKERLEKDFDEFIEYDEVAIYDIMEMHDGISDWEQNKKLIFIVKKETHNLERINNLFKKYKKFGTRKILIIDDEADFASVGFKRDIKADNGISANVLSTKIDKLRGGSSNTSFLQVTATPYSLYLQPEDNTLNGEARYPLRPAFTELVPIHDQYVGGDYYFEKSENPKSPASFIRVDVPEKEMEVLGKQHMTYMKTILETPNLRIFRTALINFLVAGTIRNIQESKKKTNRRKRYKCSCLLHTSQTKAIHQWQYGLVDSLIQSLKDNPTATRHLVEASYANIKLSVEEKDMPSRDEVVKGVQESLRGGEVGIFKINSEGEIKALLDNKGQLRLGNPFNIFIGGQMLDRGITIENLICFFYGWNPRTHQQDTVLQHSRMYGARSDADMRVTRFYTLAKIYDVMKRIHNFDSVLRKAFEKGAGNDGVVFQILDSQKEIKICAPSKILLSNTETIKPGSRLLPTGIQTVSKTEMKPILTNMDKILNNYTDKLDKEEDVFTLPFADARQIIRLINLSFEFSKKHENKDQAWKVIAFQAALERLCSKPNHKKELLCIVRKNRNASRFKNNGLAFTDAPDDGRNDLQVAKKHAIDLPVLMLLKQSGEKDRGWRNTPFWWPVLVCPKNTEPFIYTTN